MGLFDAIYRVSHNGVAPTPVAAPVTGIDPMTGRPVEAPLAPVAAPLDLPRPQGHGLLSAIGDIFAPQAGSFWDQALANGLGGAHRGMQDYADGRQAVPLALRAAMTTQQAAEHKLQQDVADDNAPKLVTTPTGSVVAVSKDRSSIKELYTPPEKPTETMRLIDKWQTLPEGPLKELVGRAIKGVQYTPEVIAAMGRARTETAVAAKKAQRFAPRAAGASAAVPKGYVLDGQ